MSGIEILVMRIAGTARTVRLAREFADLDRKSVV